MLWHKDGLEMVEEVDDARRRGVLVAKWDGW
jgi:hypothetical protein